MKVLGELHIHFMDGNSNEICQLLITKEVDEGIKENLVDEIIDTIISNPEDFYWINILTAMYDL